LREAATGPGIVGLDKVFKHLGVATPTVCRKQDGVVIIAINVSILFKVGVILAKDFRAN
jgi:hypothetical protein